VRFSIVIPTYQRRETVVRTVAALDRQVHRDFEVIVVDDGSTDGTAAALRSLSVPFPLTVLEQRNQGAAQARNAGVAAATGDTLLFLDDDMEADPSLLQEHERSRREGADLVIGDLPLHPESPQNVLSRGVGSWARARGERLAADRAEIPLPDLLTGQMSISRKSFERVGRFDVSFTRDGLYGGEDIDFGYRVLKAGCRVVFNPAAISHQYYDVDPADFLRRGYEAGRSEQDLILKHPERAEQLERGPHLHTRWSRWLLGPFVVAPPALSWPLRSAVAALVRSGRGGSRLRRVFLNIRAMEYRRGVRAAQRTLSTGRAVVLAYHAIADLPDDTVLGEYGVPIARFAEQLDALVGHGWTFIGLEALLRALRGEQHLPMRAVLLTFDDCYEDLLSAGVPLLAERGIPAVAFAVAGRLGGTNEWDREVGAETLDLLDADGLRELAGRGVEIGSHGYSHRRLVGVTPDELRGELEESAAQLEALGLPRPRGLSYPYGVWSQTVAAAARRTGYVVAFTVRPGVVRRHSNRFALPRVEVFASDSPRRLRLKVATAEWPDRVRTRALAPLRIRL
jgi:peptidoglycan/xylan/chitin deacetylase (PgdA/CDA1 family)/glycosyltransferase involved in cell wall biosynthesis